MVTIKAEQNVCPAFQLILIVINVRTLLLVQYVPLVLLVQFVLSAILAMPVQIALSVITDST